MIRIQGGGFTVVGGILSEENAIFLGGMILRYLIGRRI